MGPRHLLDRVVRRRAKLVPEERLRFETLLSELSAGLIHLAAADVDAAIERGFQQVVTFLGVDQGQLDEYAGSEPVVRIVWARPDFRGHAAPHGRRAIPLGGGNPAARTSRPLFPDR